PEIDMPHFLDLISPQIQRAGRLHTRKWKGLKRINYDQQLIFVKEGSIRTRFDGFSHDNEINTYILQPSGLQHRTEQTSSRDMQLYWVHFNWVYAEVPPITPTVCYHTKDFNPAFLRSAPDYTPREVISGEVS